MEKVLNKIYKEVLCYEPEMVLMEHKIEKIILELIEEEGAVERGMDAEKMRELMYQVALEAESKAYWLGFRSCLKLLAGTEYVE